MQPYDDQQVAIDKFRFVANCLIGDSMGVGKTVTAIGRDFQLRKDGLINDSEPTLIVCEKIGIDVWDYHLKAMGVPEDQILLIDPADRSEFQHALTNLRLATRYGSEPMPPYRYWVMHWDAIRLLDSVLLPKGKPIVWGHLIGDEVHLAKNRKAIRTVLFKRIKALKNTGLTGTPADNKPQDLWSILHWLYRREFSSYWRFFSEYIKWEEEEVHRRDPSTGKHTVTGYRKAIGVQNLDKLHKIIQPFYIRRTLLQVSPDMPEKENVKPPIVVKMTPRQRKQYEQMKEKALALIGAMDDKGFVLLAPAIVAVLTRLQQMALATLTPVWDVKDSDWIDPGEEEWDDWDFPKIVLSKPSPKLDAIMNLIETHEDEPFVVFSQFRGMVDLVEEECQLKGISVVKIHGGITSKKKRTELIKQFQDGEARVFVGTIAAAGKTITLTRAHLAIFADLSWNPSKNVQAEDRLWRRTQKNGVRIYQIQSEDSIDQMRATTISKKGQLVDAIMNPRRAF
jgi:SNF2 family DNA or RNA helicase